MKNLLIGHRAKSLQYQGFWSVAQSAERILGKDEVTSSNLVKSSIIRALYPLKMQGSFIFPCRLSEHRMYDAQYLKKIGVI